MSALECPLCHGMEFWKEEAELRSKWHFSNQWVKIAVCKKCKFMMLFSEEGESIWDFNTKK